MELKPKGPVDVYRPDAPTTVIRLTEVTTGGTPLGDTAWLNLSKEMTGALYAAVDRGSRLEPPSDREGRAQHQLIIATAAIAGAEMETLRALCALGLHPPAQIHARAIGLLARNAVVFHEDAALALECYDSLEPSRRELSKAAQSILQNAALDELLEKRYQDAAGTSMRRLEQAHSALFQREEHYLMSNYEQNLWSKWAHGDIIALAEAADGVRRATDDLRGSLVVKSDLALSLLFRTGLFASVLLAVLADNHCISGSTVEGLIARHKDLTAQITVFKESREAFKRALRGEGPSDEPFATGP